MTARSPIILIGAARSGTKFLRDVLASADGTAAVPYDVNYVWRYGVEQSADDVLDQRDITDQRRQFILKSLRSLAKASTDDILIEKTVANTLRVPYVDAVLPNARFIHLIRDGREVAESAMRQWQAPPNWSALFKKLREIPVQNLGYVTWFGFNFAKGLFSGRKGGNVWGPRFPGINAIAEAGPLSQVCALQWRESYIRANLHLPKLADAKSRVFTIRYEDLIRDESAILGLLDWLEVRGRKTILDTFHKKLRPNEPALWRRLPQQDLTVFDQFLTPTLKELGYIE